MEDKKRRRRPPTSKPEIDLLGPAALGDEAPEADRRRVRRKVRPTEGAGTQPRPKAPASMSEAGARAVPSNAPAAQGAPVWAEDKASPVNIRSVRKRVSSPPSEEVLEATGPSRLSLREENQPIREVRPKVKKKTQNSPSKAKTPKKRSLFTRFVIFLIWTGIGLGVIGVVAGIAGYSYFSQDLPSTEGLKNYAPPTVTYFYSDDGRVIGEYANERRFVVPIEQISPNAINAFIAVEDDQFFYHKGVNPKAIIRAAIANFQSDDISQGGSTITQQVVKTFLLTSERSYVRKIKEMILAVRLERNFNKDEILYLYMNQIYLGRGAYGIESAARTYFGKSALELSINEAAQLAGIIRSPNRNPLNDPEHAENRRITALQRMVEVGVITEGQYLAAKEEKLTFLTEWPNPNTSETPYFTEHVRRILEAELGIESLYNDGWKVYTAVNIEAQRAADIAAAKGLLEYGRRRTYSGPALELADELAIDEFVKNLGKNFKEDLANPYKMHQAVVMEVDGKNLSLNVNYGVGLGTISRKNLEWSLRKRDIKKLFKRGDVVWVRFLPQDSPSPAEAGTTEASGLFSPVRELSLEYQTDVQVALLSMDLSNGDIKAMVGGRDFSESQFNRAIQSQRQPGSSFKPILYASAMDHGFTPGSIMNDAPFVVDDTGSGKRWKPVNSDGKFKGPMSVYSALVSSRNLISVKLLDRIGFAALAETAKNLGINEKLPESLAVSLGAHGIHIPELITAYSAFANMGTRVEPRYIIRIEDRDGNLRALNEPKRIPAIDPGSACAVTWMLRGVVEHGTGTVVKPLGRPVAGKTGTTNDYSDAWFVGFTPELVTAVWVGTDEQRPRAVGEVGGRAAGPIFLYYMKEVLKDLPVRDFVVPPEAELVAEGGPLGVCYKAGTLGFGISELIDTSNPEDDFLRDDFEDIEAEILGGAPGLGDSSEYEEEERSFWNVFQGSKPRQATSPPAQTRVPVETPRQEPSLPATVNQNTASPQTMAEPAPVRPEVQSAPPPPQIQPERSPDGRLAPYGGSGSSSGRLSTYGEGR